MVNEELKRLLAEIKANGEKNGKKAKSDSHDQNIGFIRDSKDDQEVKLAPNYDKDRSFERDGM